MMIGKDLTSEYLERVGQLREAACEYGQITTIIADASDADTDGTTTLMDHHCELLKDARSMVLNKAMERVRECHDLLYQFNETPNHRCVSETLHSIRVTQNNLNKTHHHEISDKLKPETDDLVTERSIRDIVYHLLHDITKKGSTLYP